MKINFFSIVLLLQMACWNISKGVILNMETFSSYDYLEIKTSPSPNNNSGILSIITNLGEGCKLQLRLGNDFYPTTMKTEDGKLTLILSIWNFESNLCTTDQVDRDDYGHFISTFDTNELIREAATKSKELKQFMVTNPEAIKQQKINIALIYQYYKAGDYDTNLGEIFLDLEKITSGRAESKILLR